MAGFRSARSPARDRPATGRPRRDRNRRRLHGDEGSRPGRPRSRPSPQPNDRRAPSPPGSRRAASRHPPRGSSRPRGSPGDAVANRLVPDPSPVPGPLLSRPGSLRPALLHSAAIGSRGSGAPREGEDDDRPVGRPLPSSVLSPRRSLGPVPAVPARAPPPGPPRSDRSPRLLSFCACQRSERERGKHNPKSYGDEPAVREVPVAGGAADVPRGEVERPAANYA